MPTVPESITRGFQVIPPRFISALENDRAVDPILFQPLASTLFARQYGPSIERRDHFIAHPLSRQMADVYWGVRTMNRNTRRLRFGVNAIVLATLTLILCGFSLGMSATAHARAELVFDMNTAVRSQPADQAPVEFGGFLYLTGLDAETNTRVLYRVGRSGALMVGGEPAQWLQAELVGGDGKAVYFIATNASSGQRALWRHDGRQTVQIFDLNERVTRDGATRVISRPRVVALGRVASGTIFIVDPQISVQPGDAAAVVDHTSYGVYFTNGTRAGTGPTGRLAARTHGLYDTAVAHNDAVWMTTRTTSGGVNLWRMDGWSPVSRPLMNLSAGSLPSAAPSALYPTRRGVVVAAPTRQGCDLWASAGKVSNTIKMDQSSSCDVDVASDSAGILYYTRHAGAEAQLRKAKADGRGASALGVSGGVPVGLTVVADDVIYARKESSGRTRMMALSRGVTTPRVMMALPAQHRFEQFHTVAETVIFSTTSETGVASDLYAWSRDRGARLVARSTLGQVSAVADFRPAGQLTRAVGFISSDGNTGEQFRIFDPATDTVTSVTDFAQFTANANVGAPVLTVRGKAVFCGNAADGDAIWTQDLATGSLKRAVSRLGDVYRPDPLQPRPAGTTRYSDCASFAVRANGQIVYARNDYTASTHNAQAWIANLNGTAQRRYTQLTGLPVNRSITPEHILNVGGNMIASMTFGSRLYARIDATGKRAVVLNRQAIDPQPVSQTDKVLWFKTPYVQSGRRMMRLWVSRGTPSTTAIIAQGLDDVYAAAALNGKTYAFARRRQSNGVTAHGLYRINANRSATLIRRFDGFRFDRNRLDTLSLVNYRGALYASAGNAIWKSNGSATGTTKLLSGVAFSTLAVAGGQLWVADRSVDNHGGWSLFRSNGSAVGTRVAHDQGNPLDQQMQSPRRLHVAENWLYFYASHQRLGVELWRMAAN